MQTKATNVVCLSDCNHSGQHRNNSGQHRNNSGQHRNNSGWMASFPV
jgi:hypothetical protein